MKYLILFLMVFTVASCATWTNTTETSITVNTDKGVDLVCHFGLTIDTEVKNVDSKIICSGIVPLGDGKFLKCKNLSVEFLKTLKDNKLDTNQHCSLE